MERARALILLAGLMTLASCATSAHKRTLDDLLTHPAGKPEYLARFRSDLPLEDKVYPATPEQIDMLSLDNELNGFPEHPISAPLEPDFVNDFKKALVELPEPLRKRISRRFVGFFLVRRLGGSAYTDIGLDAKRAPGGVYMMLDVDSLSRRANEWMSWKEGSPFKPEKGYSLDGVLEKEKGNSRSAAIQYILLHEMGHIYSVDTRAHPLWTLKADEISSLDGYDYASESWKVEKKSSEPGAKYATVFDFPQRKQVRYYSLSRSDVPLSKAADVYHALSGTNLPTLYGSTGPYDDFAELFAQYVHVVLLKKPWAIRVKNGKKTVLDFPPCVLQPRCAAKRAILEKYLSADGISGT